jgi:hypothetical protein
MIRGHYGNHQKAYKESLEGRMTLTSLRVFNGLIGQWVGRVIVLGRLRRHHGGGLLDEAVERVLLVGLFHR